MRSRMWHTHTLNSFVPSTLRMRTAFVRPYPLNNASSFFCSPGSSFPKPFYHHGATHA